MPVTTATLERSFICMWRVKTYLRSTILAERSFGLALLHTYRDVQEHRHKQGSQLHAQLNLGGKSNRPVYVFKYFP